MLVNSHNLQGYASTMKMYSLFKWDFFWKGICKHIDKFIQNCSICRHHSLQNLSYNYNYVTPARRAFDLIACNLVDPFHPPSSKGNSHIHMYGHLTNFSIAIPIPDRHAETVIQAYLKHIYATFGRLTMITDNSKEFNNDLFKKMAEELGLRHQFTSPYHTPSNDILEKVCSFLKACIRIINTEN